MRPAFCRMVLRQGAVAAHPQQLLMIPVWSVMRRSCTGGGPLRDRSKPLVEKLFGKYLIWTNTISCGLLMAAGDAAAQRIEQYRADGDDKVVVMATDDAGGRRVPFDWRRIGIMFVVGLTQGPVQHVFYSWLDRRFVAVNLRNVAKKIALDQSIMSPVAIIQFFTAAGILEGQTAAETWAELRAKFLTVFVSDCMFWPIAQFINFNFTPAKYRVMYINVLTMCYNVWLSIVKHNDDLQVMWLQPAASPPPAAAADDDKPPPPAIVVDGPRKDL